MNPKLRKKLILVAILAIIYIIFILNIHKIKFTFGMLSIYNEEKNTESIKETEISNDPVVEDKHIIVDNPLQNIININENRDNIEEPVDNSATVVDESVPTQSPISETTKSYMIIIEEYNDILGKLRVKFEDDLDGLIEQGKKEYIEESTSSTQLFIKYMTEGSELEKISDGQFDSIMKNMQKELKDNGHDTSVIKEIEDYYEDFKKAKKEDIISQGIKYVK